MLDSPFNVSAMWHDGQFTYLRSSAQESPALYERQDGDPSLVAYDLTEDGLYIVRRVLGDGWAPEGNGSRNPVRPQRGQPYSPSDITREHLLAVPEALCEGEPMDRDIWAKTDPERDR